VASPASDSGSDVDLPDSLRVTFIDRDAQDLVVHVAGHLDLATAPRLDDHLRERLDGAPPRRILLDLSQLDFMGGAGVAVLLRLHRWCRDHGCAPLRLTTARGPVDRTLRLLDVEDLFERWPDP
jgi:anti-anti-sigma factor